MYQEKGSNYGRSQVGLAPAAGGPIQPVTRDTNRYWTLTLSADGKSAATVQVRMSRSLHILPGTGSQGADSKPVLPPGQEVRGFNWAADGSLLVSDGPRLLRVTADGKNQMQLIGDSAAGIVDPAGPAMICSDPSVFFSCQRM